MNISALDQHDKQVVVEGLLLKIKELESEIRRLQAIGKKNSVSSLYSKQFLVEQNPQLASEYAKFIRDRASEGGKNGFGFTEKDHLKGCISCIAYFYETIENKDIDDLFKALSDKVEQLD